MIEKVWGAIVLLSVCSRSTLFELTASVHLWFEFSLIFHMLCHLRLEEAEMRTSEHRGSLGNGVHPVSLGRGQESLLAGRNSLCLGSGGTLAWALTLDWTFPRWLVHLDWPSLLWTLLGHSLLLKSCALFSSHPSLGRAWRKGLLLAAAPFL